MSMLRRVNAWVDCPRWFFLSKAWTTNEEFSALSDGRITLRWSEGWSLG